MQQNPYGGPQQPYGGPQQPYGGPPPHGGPQYPYGPPPNQKPPPSSTHVVFAAISLGCGIFAMFVPIPVLDVILGALGIVLASIAMAKGVRGLAIAGLVVSIVGLLIAISFTMDYFGMIPNGWYLMLTT